MKNAWLRARNRPGGVNLSLSERLGMTIWWQAYSGMKLGQAKIKLRKMVEFEDKPDILILHCGGNDLGRICIGDLRCEMKSQLKDISQMLPKTKIIWSQILPRKTWRYSENNMAMERCRFRLNNSAATEAIRMGGGYIKYPDIKLSEESLWSNDGVHLSAIGNELLLNTLQSALEKMALKGQFICP